MFLRTKITPTGKTLQLVASFRDKEGQPRQRILLSLGDADLPEALRADVIRGVESRLSGQVDIFSQEAGSEVAAWVDDIIRRIDLRALAPVVAAAAAKSAPVEFSLPETLDHVVIDQVTHQDTTVLGPALVALRIWEHLEMPAALDALGFNQVQKQAIAIEVINRLVDPVSENALPAWVPTTALPELLGTRSLPGGRDAYYRACDHLLLHREAIAAHLRKREQFVFQLTRTILLYDLTNTYFEGDMERNEMAKRGKSKEKRSDCPQVVVGMVFDEHGFELGHEVFSGNKSDAKSLVDMAVHLRSAVDGQTVFLPNERPLVIVDGGIASAANRQLFQAQGFDYLANDSRPGRVKYAELFKDEASFTSIPGREGTAAIQVRSLQDPLAAEGVVPDTLILCKSAGRALKERAILSSAERRFLAGIERLRASMAKGRRTSRNVIAADLARIINKNPRASRYYQATVIDKADGTHEISCERKQDAYDQTDSLFGCYVLRTCSQRLSEATDWWHLYMTLARAENGFRALKSDLGLRPIRHQLADRAKSHILISVLAYHLLQFIAFTLAKTGDHRSWETLRRILGTHCYTTIVLPTTDGTIHRLRKPGTPDQAQQQIYQALNIDWRTLPSIHTTA